MKNIKNENNKDGIDNNEHILDIAQGIDVSYTNIKDNTDMSIEIFKLRKKENLDEDMLDALQIACENIIEIEKEASVLNAQLEILGKNERKLQEIYQKIKDLEEISRKMLERILN